MQSVILTLIVEVEAVTPYPASATTSKLKSYSGSLIVGIAIAKEVLSVSAVLILTYLRPSDVSNELPVKLKLISGQIGN